MLVHSKLLVSITVHASVGPLQRMYAVGVQWSLAQSFLEPLAMQ